MCSFLLSNFDIGHRLEDINHFMQMRGPDTTARLEARGLTFVHNLLSITGEFTPQPFVSDDERVFCIYNGQIYNYREFGDYSSDGCCLIPVYERYGEDFIRRLDGEYAIVLVDFSRDLLLVSADVFATKPCWLGRRGSKFAVASYASAVQRLGFDDPMKVKPNQTLCYRLSTLELIDERTVYDFDLRQHKDSYDDWDLAFERAMDKRTRGLRERPFLCLSSGYDSGAIACEMKARGIAFKGYTIQAHEDGEVLNQRFKLHQPCELVSMRLWDYVQGGMEVETCGDAFVYKGYDYKKDQAAAGLSHIFRHARDEGYKINFSGHGADEIISDYGMGGKKIFDTVSQFGGLFPEDLAAHFPYKNFFDETMIQYLNKEEYVAGAYGIETRYPFLDTQLVQEFLWLDVELKNAEYKAPIKYYLEKRGYPYDANRKVGFYAGSDLRHPMISWRDVLGLWGNERLTSRQKFVLPLKVAGDSLRHAFRRIMT